MTSPTTIRFNKEERIEMEQARKILGISKNIHGEIPSIIKNSVKFVIEFNRMIWDQFNNQYPPQAREYIKRKLIDG